MEVLMEHFLLRVQSLWLLILWMLPDQVDVFPDLRTTTFLLLQGSASLNSAHHFRG
jgi:hypothetical protein